MFEAVVVVAIAAVGCCRDEDLACCSIERSPAPEKMSSARFFFTI